MPAFTGKKDMKTMAEISAQLVKQLRERTGIGIGVREVALQQLERFEYKAIRWTDERITGLQKVKFKEK